jgi:hypothetical protein
VSFIDRVKQQATQVAQKAQESVKQGQAKLEEVQQRRRVDALLRDLGVVLYAEKTGKATGETAAEIERIVAELRQQEAEGATIPGPGQEDDFKLDEL